MNSAFAGRICKDRVPIDNLIKKCGIVMVSCCVLCDVYCCEEDAFHVFFQYSYAWKIYDLLAYIFKAAFPRLGSTMGYFEHIFSQNISSQFYNLQAAMFMYILSQIWFNRNRARFDRKYNSARRVIALGRLIWLGLLNFVLVMHTLGVKEIFLWIWVLVLSIVKLLVLKL